MAHTINDLIASIEVELESAERRHAKTIKEVELILATAQQEGRSNLTEEEDNRVSELREQRVALKDEIKGIRQKLADANEVKSEEEARTKEAAESKPTGVRKPAYDQVGRVGQEERTYNKENDPHGAKFFRDVSRQFLFQDVESATRLARHSQEERVERAEKLSRAGVGTSAFEGLVVPQYLVDMYAPATAALRPFADMCNQHPLPESGMSVEISRITTASDVDIQGSELSEVAEQDMGGTILSVPVRTAAGQQTISRQAIDRGTGIESVVIQDLFNRYATRVDSALLNTASKGLSGTSGTVTYTSNDPSAAELYPKILEAASKSEAALLQMGTPTHAVMHSRRWYWLQSQLSEKWPMISQPQIPVQSVGTNNGAPYGSGVRGVLPNGLQVVVDNNIVTNSNSNQDEVYVVPQAECHLWEDPSAPLFIRAEQPKAANLGVLLVAYGYFAFTFERYSGSHQKIAGTGLATPAFDGGDGSS